MRKRTSHEFEFSMIVGGYHALRDHAAEGLHRGTRCWRKFDSDSVLMVQQLLWLVLAWLIARLAVCLLVSLVVLFAWLLSRSSLARCVVRIIESLY